MTLISKIGKILGWFFLYVFSFAFITIMITTGLRIFNFSQSTLTFFGMLSGIPTTYFLYKFYSSNYKENVVDFSSPFKKYKLIEAIGLLIIPIFIMFIWVFTVVSFLPLSGGSETTKELTKMGYLGVFLAVIVAPITEEIIFRGILYKILENSNKLFYILTSAFTFGIMHYQFTNNIMSDIVPVIVTFGHGVIFSLLYLYKKDIYLPIASHALYNLIVITTALSQV